MNKIVVLFSGAGSNFESIVEKLHKPDIINVCGAISNIPTAKGNEIAIKNNIPLCILDSNEHNFDEKLKSTIEELNPNWIVLAGFMKILGDSIVKAFYGRMINIHPSLLPKYKGLNTHKKVLQNKDHEHGSSVHFVSSDLDSGPLIAQIKFIVNHEVNVQELEGTIKANEHYLYPKVISWLASSRLRLEDDIVYLDDQPLPKTGIIYPPVEQILYKQRIHKEN